jgi:hypothetical protein
MKEGDLELLHEIAQFEDSNNMDELRIGWSWRHVRIWLGGFWSQFLIGGRNGNI